MQFYSLFIYGISYISYSKARTVTICSYDVGTFAIFVQILNIYDFYEIFIGDVLFIFQER